jgi:hypothetical protein
MPKFGDVKTPADQLIWRQLIEKEKAIAYNAPKSGFSVRNCVSKEDVPVRHKPGHVDPSKDKHNMKGFDPKDYGWDPQGEDALEFRRCRKRATEEANKRFLFPETTAQESGWCLKGPKPKRDRPVKLPPASLDSGAANEAKAEQRRPRRKEGGNEQEAETRSGLGKWASESNLSAAVPTDLSAAPPLSYVSSALPTELSRATSWPGIPKELVLRAKDQDGKVATAMIEYKRYLCYGDRGNRHFHPLGETDATAYANAFMLATSGVPPHKWNPRA